MITAQDEIGWKLRSYFQRNYTNYELLGWARNPMDYNWECTVRHKATDTRLKCYVSPEDPSLPAKWRDPEAFQRCKEVDLDASRKDRRAVQMNQAPGEFFRVIHLYFKDEPNPHKFRHGPGSCGRTVMGLKVAIVDDEIHIRQWCEDNVSEDLFVYPKRELKRWVFYKTDDPSPSKRVQHPAGVA